MLQHTKLDVVIMTVSRQFRELASSVLSIPQKHIRGSQPDRGSYVPRVMYMLIVCIMILIVEKCRPASRTAIGIAGIPIEVFELYLYL